MDVLFVFAHQDDEVGAAPWIEDELEAGNRVLCAYLTDGASRSLASVRDEESRKALGSLGVASNNIAFFEGDNRIRDNHLIEHLAQAIGALETWIDARSAVIGRLYSLAWEGGHPDHDAAHIVALLLSVRRGVIDAWQFPLYNAENCLRPFFRTLRLLRSRAPTRVHKHTLLQGLRYAMFCWKFSSQISTWLGLFPELFIRRVILRREKITRLDVVQALKRPHDGALLYERMFGVSYDKFRHYAAQVSPELATRYGDSVG